MKFILYINYGLVLFLSLLTAIGFYNAYNLYYRHGFSYTVTTEINGEETIRTVTLYENLSGVAILFILLVVLLSDTVYLREVTKNVKY